MSVEQIEGFVIFTALFSGVWLFILTMVVCERGCWLSREQEWQRRLHKRVAGLDQEMRRVIDAAFPADKRRFLKMLASNEELENDEER